MKAEQVLPGVLIVISVGASIVCGCDVLTAEQRMHLNEATLEVNVLNERCQAGDDEACRLGLDAAAMYLNSLQGGE